MNSWKWIAAGAGLTTLLPAVGLMMYPNFMTLAIAVLWAAAASLGAGWLVRNRQAEEQREFKRSMEERAILTLTHHRHDWMNELQILYGYIQLGKLDKSVQCVERIKERMQQDSRLSRLGIPSLVFYLHAYRTFNTGLQLEVEMIDQVQLEGKLSSRQELNVTGAVMRVLAAFEQSGSTGWEENRQLMLTFIVEEDRIIAEFDGEGDFGDPESLKENLGRAVSQRGIQIEQMDPNHALYRLNIPYGT